MRGHGRRRRAAALPERGELPSERKQLRARCCHVRVPPARGADVVDQVALEMTASADINERVERRTSTHEQLAHAFLSINGAHMERRPSIHSELIYASARVDQHHNRVVTSASSGLKQWRHTTARPASVYVGPMLEQQLNARTPTPHRRPMQKLRATLIQTCTMDFHARRELIHVNEIVCDALEPGQKYFCLLEEISLNIIIVAAVGRIRHRAAGEAPSTSSVA